MIFNVIWEWTLICGTLTFRKSSFIYFDQSLLKMMKNAFYFILKPFSWSRYLNFYLDFLVMQKKRFYHKCKVDFKLYDVTTWWTNNYNTHFAKYLINWRQADNEIWLVNRAQQEKHFSLKSCRKLGRETSSLDSIYFNSPQLFIH